MIVDRIENCGVHYIIIRRDGKIIAHANSAAQCEATTMIGGVSTCTKGKRGQGLGGQVVSRLCRDILAKGKTPCLFSIRGEEHNLYHRISFQKSEVGTLTKPADGCRRKKWKRAGEKIRETEKAVPRKQGMPSYIPIYNQLYEDIVNGVYEKSSSIRTSSCREISCEQIHCVRH